MHLTRYYVEHRLTDDRTVIVNTLSGAIDVIDNKYMPLLREPSRITSNIDIYEPLVERGYLFPSLAAENAEVQSLLKGYTGYGRPTMFVICPTYACNLRCVYCFEGTLTQEKPRVLTDEQIDAIFVAIDELRDDDRASVQLFGGEPFMRANEPAVTRILKMARDRDMGVSAITNGVLLKSFLPLLLEHGDHLLDFQITVDGPEAMHDMRRPHAGGQGSFAQIVESIDAALSEGVHIRLRVNIDQQNIHTLGELATFIIEKGWNEKSNFGALLSPVDDHQGREVKFRLTEHETARQWLRMLKDNPDLALFRADLFRNLEHIIKALDSDELTYPRFQFCESNNLSCYTFGTEGNIYLCAEAIGDDEKAVGTYYPEFKLDGAELEQWNGRSILTIEKCRDCRVATLCGGGCALAALAINGSIHDPHCNGAEETLHAYLDSIKDRLLLA